MWPKYFLIIPTYCEIISWGSNPKPNNWPRVRAIGECELYICVAIVVFLADRDSRARNWTESDMQPLALMLMTDNLTSYYPLQRCCWIYRTHSNKEVEHCKNRNLPVVFQLAFYNSALFELRAAPNYPLVWNCSIRNARLKAKTYTQTNWSFL